MRRSLFTIAAMVLVAGLIPASALARRHHHHRHHARARHARIMRFGDTSTTPASTSSSDNAGTVKSFNNGVLTIMLSDGSTAGGAVTNNTELECEAAGQSSAMHTDGDSGGGDNGSSSGDDQSSTSTEDQNEANEDQNEANEDQNEANEDQNEANEDQNEANEDQAENQNSCSTADLTPGTVVREATLRIGSSGATWQKVELVS